MTNQPLLTIHNLYKSFAGRTILKNVQANFKAGTLNLIIGSNGSGKSTLLKIIAGLLKADKGEIRYSGQSPSGYIGHETLIYDNLTAMENLQFWNKVAQFSATKEQLNGALKSCELDKYKNMPVRYFSRGMLQRLQITRILIQNTPLLLLDEPATGLDIAGQNFLRDKISEFRKNGSCIIMISHDYDRDYQIAESVFEIKNRTLNSLTD